MQIVQRTFASSPLYKSSFKIFTRFVCLFTRAFFEIVFELAFIHCSVGIHPFSSPLSHSIQEFTLVVTSIGPLIFTKTVGFSFFIITNILISVYKKLFSFSIFQELHKISSVSAYFMLVNSLTMLSVELPVALVVISFGRFPNTISIFCSIFPLAFEDFSIIPLKATKAFSNPIHKLSLVNSIDIFFTAVSFQIIFIMPFENGSISNHDTFPIFNLITILPKKDSFLFLNNFEVRFADQVFDFELFIHWFIILQIGYILFFFRYDKQSVLFLVNKFLIISLDFRLILCFVIFDTGSFLLFQGLKHSIGFLSALKDIF